MAKVEANLNVNSVSRISAGTVIKGEITSPSDIRVDGTFEGRIISKGRVVVGESATIKGDVICENIDLWGNLDGNVFVKDTLSLKEGCEINGNLHIKRLSVELGATFNGNYHMITEAEFDKLSSGASGSASASTAPGTSGSASGSASQGAPAAGFAGTHAAAARK